MNKLVYREQEMRTLQNEYNRDGSSLVVLYGRRRVGKTTLISEFIKDKKALFYLASEESELQNRMAFKDKAADLIDSELLRSVEVNSWDVIFKAIMNTSFDSKPVIVIDEFQYLGKANPAFPSIFQRIWEEQLKDKQVMVILCGSLISMMESQTLAYGSPLYGRSTAQIRLKQIPFVYYHEFFKDKNRKDLLEMYSVTGGVPKYIELFSENNNIYDAIESCVLNRSSYLYNEPYFLLQQEVSDLGSYFSLIKAIALGNHKLSAISSALQVKATSLTKYLKTLSDMDIVEREVPVTEDNPEKSKRGLYKIKDNYLRFWFAFVYPNMSFIESGHSELVMNKIRSNLIDNHIAFVYEDVCREKMWELNASGAWPFVFSRVGRYWDSNVEIDVVALDPDGKNMILGECKYWQGPVGANVFFDLEEKGNQVTWNRDDRKTYYILFSVAGFSDGLKALASTRTDILLYEGY
ncbi:MAG: ATP-binding protein [Erysipelotrichaceae bacterium]|nr:ATP-binding protein [Erysipelotrichaceae bacterium]